MRGDPQSMKVTGAGSGHHAILSFTPLRQLFRFMMSFGLKSHIEYGRFPWWILNRVVESIDCFTGATVYSPAWLSL
jgi:hypothetical protein